MAECNGDGRFGKRSLPKSMVPTTTGSVSEVSQWIIVKDEERHLKLPTLNFCAAMITA